MRGEILHPLCGVVAAVVGDRGVQRVEVGLVVGVLLAELQIGVGHRVFAGHAAQRIVDRGVRRGGVLRGAGRGSQIGRDRLRRDEAAGACGDGGRGGERWGRDRFARVQRLKQGLARERVAVQQAVHLGLKALVVLVGIEDAELVGFDVHRLEAAAVDQGVQRAQLVFGAAGVFGEQASTRPFTRSFTL